MVCQSCGHDNPERNRYCGMCGVRLEATAESAKETAPPAPAARAAGASRSSTSVLGLEDAPQPPSRPSRSVSGPSFLGLNDEPAPSDANYLLDDEEEQGGHLGLLIASLLLVAVAFAAFHYRARLSAYAGPLYAALMERVNPQPPAPAAPPPAPQATDSAAPASAPPAAASDASPAAAASPAATPEDKSAPATDTKADAKPPEPAKPTPDVAEETGAKKQGAQPAKVARATPPKPRPVEAVAPENDPLLKLAQKYIHGQGVRADCATGMAYLREAMKRPNYAAASQMGALYATGTCVPLDRLAAYRYFTSAMQLAPDDPWLGQERDKLYGQMTSAERRQANRE